MDIFNILGKAAPAVVSDATASAVSDTAAQTTPGFTAEQQEQVLKFLDELDVQRDNDPEAYKKNLRALGLIPDGVDDPSMEQLSNLTGLTEAIGQMRTSVSSTPAMAVNLPGGKSVLGNEGIEAKQAAGIMVTPEPGFTVKTKVLPDGAKVFINLCTHEGLDLPSMKKRLNDEGESVEGMNVPISVGPVRTEKDKNGTECLVYDMIVNPKVLQDATDDETGQQRDFICHLAMQSVEQKNKDVMFDRRYKLPKLKYMGTTIQSQHIRDIRAYPKIEEVSSSSSKKQPPLGSKRAPAASVDNVIEPDKDLPFRLAWVVRSAPNGGDVDLENSLLPPGSTELPLQSNTNGRDYIEPIHVPADGVIGIAFLADFTGAQVGSINPRQMGVRLSPFKLQIKAPGFKMVSLYFPCAVDAPTATSTIRRPEGYVQRLEYCLYVEVDRNHWDAQVDAGSKPWLVAQALSSDDGTSGGTAGEDDVSIYGGAKVRAVRSDDEGCDEFRRGLDGDGKVREEDDLPEDRFHINLPKSVDQYTGVQLDSANDELPEDRFHKKDASSQFLINQREQGIKDKWAKHDKEKSERLNDPNIEYVEMDDYRPGGKYGPPVEEDSATAAAQVTKEELKKAAEIVATHTAGVDEIGLQSKMWTELLD